MSSLVEFLLARIGEDEEPARYLLPMYPQPTGVAKHDAARVLRECKAKRAIVAGHSALHVCPNLTDDGYTDYSANDGDDGYRPCPTLRALAQPFADHEAFDRAWVL